MHCTSEALEIRSNSCQPGLTEFPACSKIRRPGVFRRSKVGCSYAGTYRVPSICAALGFLLRTLNVPGTVAKTDVVCSLEAARARGVNARRSAIVYGATASADVVVALSAVRNYRVLRVARGEAFGCVDTGNGLAHEGEVGVGRPKPVHHVIPRHELSGNL